MLQIVDDPGDGLLPRGAHRTLGGTNNRARREIVRSSRIIQLYPNALKCTPLELYHTPMYRIIIYWEDVHTWFCVGVYIFGMGRITESFPRCLKSHGFKNVIGNELGGLLSGPQYDWLLAELRKGAAALRFSMSREGRGERLRTEEKRDAAKGTHFCS